MGAWDAAPLGPGRSVEETVPQHLDRTNTVAGLSVVCVGAVRSSAVVGGHLVGAKVEVCPRSGWSPFCARQGRGCLSECVVSWAPPWRDLDPRHFAQTRGTLRTGPPRCSCDPSHPEGAFEVGAVEGSAPALGCRPHSKQAFVRPRVAAMAPRDLIIHLHEELCATQKAEARPSILLLTAATPRARRAQLCAHLPPRRCTQVRTTFRSHQSPTSGPVVAPPEIVS